MRFHVFSRANNHALDWGLEGMRESSRWLDSAGLVHAGVGESLGKARAAAYFESALYGDPVEVTGTPIELSAADGDIYDWTIDYETWKTMSALDDTESTVVSAPAKSPQPAGP